MGASAKVWSVLVALAICSPAFAETENETKLLALAKKKFGKLTPADDQLFRAAATATFARYTKQAHDNVDPAKAKSWATGRALSADRIVWLCVDTEASTLVAHKGVQVYGARIEGRIELSDAKIRFPLRLVRCSVPYFAINNGEVHSLSLRGSHVDGLNATGVDIKRDCLLAGGVFDGSVSLVDATIGGNLGCSGAKFKAWFAATRVKVTHNISLSNNCEARAGVSVAGAVIGGNLDCDDALFENSGGWALNGEACRVTGYILLRRSRVVGRVRFFDATVGAAVECDGCSIEAKKSPALDLENAEIGNGVLLRSEFEAIGGVRLVGTKIGGSLVCIRAKFTDPKGIALAALGADIKGNCILAESVFTGSVWLFDATIGKELACDGMRCDGSFIASRVKVGRGVRMGEKLKVRGQIDLSGAQIGGNFLMNNNVEVEGLVDLSGAQIGGSFLMNNDVDVEGQVVLDDAQIGGDVWCDFARFVNRGGYAFRAEGSVVVGNFHMRNTEVTGGMFLVDVKVGATLDLARSTLTAFNYEDRDEEEDEERFALDAENIEVKGSVELDVGFKSFGEVDFTAAKLGTLECGGGVFTNPGGEALDAQGAEIAGDCQLDGSDLQIGPGKFQSFVAKGTVNFFDVTIHGNLACDEGKFRGPFLLNKAKIGRTLYLSPGFEGGPVVLSHARVSEDLLFAGAFHGSAVDEEDPADPQRITYAAIDAVALEVGGNVNLTGTAANGGVSFVGATILGKLDFGNARLTGGKRRALDGERLVAGNITFGSAFAAMGEVNLDGARIGLRDATVAGMFDARGAMFLNPKGKALSADLMVTGDLNMEGARVDGLVSLSSAAIRGNFTWRKVKGTPGLDMRFATAGTLTDDKSSWPDKGRLWLDGFVYDSIDGKSPLAADLRLLWLNLQPGEEFRAQPYEHFATLMRETGRARIAIDVLIAKEKHWSSHLGWWGRAWHGFLGITIGYGYRPARAAWLIGVFILLGWWVFAFGFRHQLDPDDKETKRPNMLMYSIDVFLPIVSFHQAESWMPKPGFTRGYFWLHIALGWTLTTLFVAGVTGLLR